MLKDIYNFLDKEIRLNYKSRAEAARHIGITKELLNCFLTNLKDGKGITVKSLYKLCQGLGYDIKFIKKN